MKFRIKRIFLSWRSGKPEVHLDLDDKNNIFSATIKRCNIVTFKENRCISISRADIYFPFDWQPEVGEEIEIPEDAKWY